MMVFIAEGMLKRMEGLVLECQIGRIKKLDFFKMVNRD
jgi:hypothetical protein